jgi:hypothetical protein
MIRIAVLLSAWWVLMENVLNFKWGDSGTSDQGFHTAYATMLKAIDESDFVLISENQVNHADLPDGHTNRKRLFWNLANKAIVEQVDAEVTRPWVTTPSTAKEVPSFFTPASDVPKELWLEGRLEKSKDGITSDQNKLLPTHYLHWSEHGDMDMQPGLKVVVKGSRQVWRVMQVKELEDKVTLMNAVRSRSRGSIHDRSLTEVVSQVPQQINVYHPSMIPSLTAKGERPERPGAILAVRDLVGNNTSNPDKSQWRN